jgi:hypothetical protein
MEAEPTFLRNTLLKKRASRPPSRAHCAPHSPERQRAFWGEWLAQGRLMPGDQLRPFVSFAAAFEAFDAPWKAVQLSNPIEGRWGLMSVERQAYPAFRAWAAAAER